MPSALTRTFMLLTCRRSWPTGPKNGPRAIRVPLRTDPLGRERPPTHRHRPGPRPSPVWTITLAGVQRAASDPRRSGKVVDCLSPTPTWPHLPRGRGKRSARPQVDVLCAHRGQHGQAPAEAVRGGGGPRHLSLEALPAAAERDGGVGAHRRVPADPGREPGGAGRQASCRPRELLVVNGRAR